MILNIFCRSPHLLERIFGLTKPQSQQIELRPNNTTTKYIITMPSSVSFKYLDLGHIGGRGGTLRFFLLANSIPYKEDLYQYNDSVWGVEKKRLVESGENPCGTVPVAYTEDGHHHLSQHISMARYFARINQLDSGDAWKDYVQDVIADEYQGFRNIWVEKSFASTEEQKAEYVTKTVPELLAKFEALYKKYKTTDNDQAYLSTSPSGSPFSAAQTTNGRSCC